MNSIAPLPTPLHGWSILAELFDDQLTASLEVFIRRISSAIDFRHESRADRGEPNGFQGITNRGPLHRLLLSELALAETLPDEFLRRITQGEAGYYDLLTVEPVRSGRTLVLFDAGPEQLGVCRVGHLASLLLIWRKAAQAGVNIEISTLQRPGETATGDLRDLVMWWLQSRTHEVPCKEKLAETVDHWSVDDEAWVCCSESTASLIAWPSGVEIVTFDESGDGAHGTTHLQVRHRTQRALVPLPARGDCVRLLRGAGFRRKASSRSQSALEIRHPQFPGNAARLLGRTADSRTLWVGQIPRPSESAGPRLKQHTFTGPVIAAGFVGSRTVAAIYRERIVIEVIGKPLKTLGGLSFSLDDLGVRETELDLAGASPVRQLLIDGSDLLIDLPSGWWQVGPFQAPVRQVIVAAAASTNPHRPALARAMNDHLWVDGPFRDAPANASCILGAGYVGWGNDGEWTLAHLGSPDRLVVELERSPSGIVLIGGSPGFVALSKAGNLVRLVARSTRTLTKISGDVLALAVHPQMPLIAVQHGDNSVSVYDAESNTVVHRIADGVE